LPAARSQAVGTAAPREPESRKRRRGLGCAAGPAASGYKARRRRVPPAHSGCSSGQEAGGDAQTGCPPSRPSDRIEPQPVARRLDSLRVDDWFPPRSAGDDRCEKHRPPRWLAPSVSSLARLCDLPLRSAVPHSWSSSRAPASLFGLRHRRCSSPGSRFWARIDHRPTAAPLITTGDSMSIKAQPRARGPSAGIRRHPRLKVGLRDRTAEAAL
jgi:hypothetical protein